MEFWDARLFVRTMFFSLLGGIVMLFIAIFDGWPSDQALFFSFTVTLVFILFGYLAAFLAKTKSQI